LPGETPEQVLDELDAALNAVRAVRPDITIDRPDPALISESLDTESDSELVRVAAASCHDAALDTTPVGVPYGTDASTLQHRRGIPAIVLGPGAISRAHGADEFVPVDQLYKAIELYAGIALGYRGR
jgi:acetylornithine deacetylase/succinyl-diaminopimelate desuccinylase-like protein